MLIPITYRIIVKPEEVETKTASGILLAVDPKKERLAVERGEVVAIGPNTFKDFPFGAGRNINVGDKIYFAKYAGKIIRDTDDTEYIIMNDEDVLAIIE